MGQWCIERLQWKEKGVRKEWIIAGVERFGTSQIRATQNSCVRK